MAEQFPVSKLPGLLGGLEAGLPSASQGLVANTPLAITAGLALAQRKLLLIHNPNAFDVYISANVGVSIGTGFPLASKQTIGLEFYKGKAFPVYAVTDQVGATIRVMEGG